MSYARMAERAIPRRPPKASVLLVACEGLWAAIRRHHPEVPRVVFTMASPGARVSKWGHFAPVRWAYGKDGKATVHEVFLTAEGLSRTPLQVATTIMHESAHALNFARGIEDTSRNGRYHNRRFRVAAESMGLEVYKTGSFGFSGCNCPELTEKRYYQEIAKLAQAMKAYRNHEITMRQPQKDRNLKVAVCDCGRKIRTSRANMDEADIICGKCMSPFSIIEKDDPS